MQSVALRIITALEEFDTLSSVSKHQPNLQPWIGISLIFGIIGVVVVWAIYGIFQAINGDEDDKRRRRQSSSEGVENNDAFCGGDSGGFGGGDSGGGDGGGW